ncbi:hypothetical protein GALL_245130 [mine drainage metagenome]|uniref:Uncharacterized protein n=1 Tax=mine drainage metagenome TaxID=410659 RepID=A0A1J5RCP6_9ZZZZ
MKNTKTFKTTGLMAALSLTTLLAACGGGGGGGSTSTSSGTPSLAPTAALFINGASVSSTTNTVTSLDQLLVKASTNFQWSFTATLPNGQPDTSIPIVQGGTFQAISSLPGTEPTITAELPASGTTFDLLAPPGDTVKLTLTDASTGTVVANYVFNVNSALAGTWSKMSYTQASGTYDVGNCSFTVSSSGVFSGSCASSNIAGETFTLTGRQGWANVTLVGSNGWTFTSSSINAATLSGNLGSAGSWTASR